MMTVSILIINLFNKKELKREKLIIKELPQEMLLREYKERYKNP